jgi:hypothetical protein
MSLRQRKEVQEVLRGGLIRGTFVAPDVLGWLIAGGCCQTTLTDALDIYH